MAYDLVLRDPERFAGLVALSSWLPQELVAALGAGPSSMQLPGVRRARQRGPDAARRDGPGLARQPARARRRRDLREYPMGHEMRPELLRDVVEWLEGKVLSPIQLV